MNRLNRLIEYEALAARRVDTYTAGEYLADAARLSDARALLRGELIEISGWCRT